MSATLSVLAPLLFPSSLSLTLSRASDLTQQEQAAPKLADDYPEGERVFFLGEGLYGSAAQVHSTTETSVACSLAVRPASPPFSLRLFPCAAEVSCLTPDPCRPQYFPNEAKESVAFQRVVQQRPSGNYYASFEISKRLRLSGLALSRITSSLMVACSDGPKVNLGLSLKFEGKGMKVLGYSRKLERGWEFSDKAAALIEDYKVLPHPSSLLFARICTRAHETDLGTLQRNFPDIFTGLDTRNGDILRAAELLPAHPEPDKRVAEAKKWLSEQGVGKLEPVSLFAELLGKVRPPPPPLPAQALLASSD